MIGIFGGEPLNSGAVEVHRIQLRVIQKRVGLAATPGEPDALRLFIDGDDRADLPRAFCQAILHLSVCAVAIQVTPSVALRPEQRFAVFRDVRRRGIDGVPDFDERFRGIGRQASYGARRGIHFEYRGDFRCT